MSTMHYHHLIHGHQCEDRDSGGDTSILEPQQHTFGTSRALYLEPSSQEGMFGGRGYSKPGEAQIIHVQEPVDACSSLVQEASAREALHSFEDGLRHKINVHIEDFRFGLQQILTEEFHSYSHMQPPPAKWRHCESVTDSTEGESCQSQTPQLQEEEVPSATSKSSGQMDGMAGFQDDFEARARGETSKNTDTSLEQLIDRKLIELQTHAAIITSTLLSRPEYCSGQQPNSDSAQSAQLDYD